MSKAFTLLAFSFLIIGCSKQFYNFDIPVNIASLDESLAIESVVQDIEGLFKEMGIEADIRKIPIVVTDSIQGDGRCQVSLDSSAILIHSQVFLNDDHDPNLNQISRLWSVILHEIGHCYFYRTHEDKQIPAPKDFVFLFKSKMATPSGYECHYGLRSTWNSTVMSPKGLSITPQSLKKFYIQELVGLNPDPKLSDLLKHSNVQVVHQSQAPNVSTNPVPCD